jgi:hypothetical protein
VVWKMRLMGIAFYLVTVLQGECTQCH